jgi:serine/threonine protein kinase
VNVTGTRFGTKRYEPPEVSTSSEEPRSRLYDVWSMGCIVLEFIIWLLYGFEELVRFHGELDEKHAGEDSFFTINEDSKAELHKTVTKWISHMFRDRDCNKDTALGDLLGLVQEKLLVVDLPKENGTQGRASAIVFMKNSTKLEISSGCLRRYYPSLIWLICKKRMEPKVVRVPWCFAKNSTKFCERQKLAPIICPTAQHKKSFGDFHLHLRLKRNTSRWPQSQE